MQEHSSPQAGIAFVATLVGILFVGLLVFAMQNSAKKDSTAPLSKINRAPTEGELLDPKRTARLVSDDFAYFAGPQQAKVTVTEFLDFQCPYSKLAVPTVKDLMNQYRDKSVKFVFRQLPISDTHKFANAAAHASLCAKEQNRFFPMYETLFEFQENISDNFLPFAASASLDLSSFKECMASGRYDAFIRKDLSDVDALSLEGTPTFFINSQRLDGALPLEEFQQTIDAELAK